MYIAHESKFPLKSFVKENTFKLFLFDVGLLGAMMELSSSIILAYDYGTYKGFFAENYIAQSFKNVNSNLYSWNEKTANC